MSYDTPSPEVESRKPTDPNTPIEDKDLEPEGSTKKADEQG